MMHFVDARFRRRLLAGWVAVLCVMQTTLHAGDADLQPFADGERWCALGDSITHTGSYTRFVYLYHATRFPERQISFFNAGIAGDTAERSLGRLPVDVFAHRPSVTTVMLGMNDVGRSLYEAHAPSDGLEAKRQERLDSYRTNLRKVASALRESGTEVIFVTPTPFDDTAATQAPNAPGCNAALATCAQIVRALAQELDAPVVDLHAPMTALNAAIQKSDPAASLIGPDRIHPGDVGHLVMAYHFLKAQNAPAVVSEIHIDAAAAKVVRAENAEVSGFRKTSDGIAFDVSSKALPFPVPAGAEKALSLVPFTADLNREILQVGGLVPGRYALAIDEVVVGTFDHADLAEGISLAENPLTPQHRQAIDVLALDEQRFALEKKLRVLAYVEGMLGHRVAPGEAADGFDLDAAARALLARPGFSGWVADQVRSYLDLKPSESELRAELAAMQAAIRNTARPVPHRYVLTKATPP